MPEARIILAEAVVHVATAPKSNASYSAIDAAIADVRAGKAGPVPAHLRDARHQFAQGVNGVTRPVHGVVFAGMADGKKQKQERTLCPFAQDGCAGCGCEHEHIGVKFAA